jgi:membrane protein
VEENGRSNGFWRKLATIVVRTAKDSKEDRVLGLSAEVAFFALLSLPPAMLAILGGLGYVAGAFGPDVVEPVRDRVLDVAGTFLTRQTVQDVLAPLVDDLLSEGRADIISIGVIVTLWSASRATNVLLEAVRVAYDIKERRPLLKRRLLALGLTLGGMLGAVLLLPVLVVGPRVGAVVAAPLGLSEIVESVLRFLYWPVVAALGVAYLAALYHLALPERTPWRRDFPGALVALVLWLAGGTVMRLYARWSIEANSAFGPLAAPVVILLWLYATSVAVLLGAEVNAELEKIRPQASAS